MAEGEHANESAPRRLGHYELQDAIGQGGMAVVYRGVQPSLNRRVAIKVLPARFARSPELVARFDREANIAAQLNHPNIVQIIDRGQEGDTLFIVMEYVEGQSLDKLMERGELTLGKVVDYSLQICDALEYAHGKGVIHRDLKPSNVLIDAHSGRAKIADFGIAQIGTSTPGLSTLTSEHTALGTINYMSPEQRTDAHTVTHHTDIFSFGVMLYQMLTGRLPLGHFKLPSHLNPNVPMGLDEIVKKCLQEQPSDRYQSAAEIRNALSGITGWQDRYKQAMARVGQSMRHVTEHTPRWLSGRRAYLMAGLGAAVAAALVLLLIGPRRGGKPDSAAGSAADTPGANTTAAASVPTPVLAPALEQQLRTDVAAALALAGSGQPDKAIAELRGLAQRYKALPEAAGAQFALAKIHEDRRAFDDALKEYEALVQQFPNSPRAPEALLRMGGVYEQMGSPATRKYQQAAATYQRLVARYPESPQAADGIVARCSVEWRTASTSGIFKKSYDANFQRRLRDDLKTVLARDPNHAAVPAALRLMGEICPKPALNDYASAAQALAELYRREPASGPDSLYLAAQYFKKAGDAAAEAKAIQQFLSDFSGDSRADGLKKRLRQLRP